MTGHRSLIVSVLAVLLAASSTCAQQQPPLRFAHLVSAADQDGPPTAPSPGSKLTNWYVQFEPMVRYIGPAGEVRLPGGASRATLVDLADVNLNSPRLMPGFDISVRKDRLRVNAIGLFYDIDDRTALAEEGFSMGGVDFLAGQRSSISHTYTQLDFRFAYTLLDRPISPLDAEGHKARVRVDAEVGLRFYDFEFEFENLDTGQRGSDDRTFIEPHAGFKAAFNIYEDITIDLYTNFGLWPFDTQAFSWDIGVGFQWRPVDYFGAQIGYRSTIFRLNEGSGVNEFEWAGSYQGLYAGLQLRF